MKPQPDDVDDDDELYQSGCGAAVPVVVSILLRPQRGRARGDRERDVGGVEVLAGPEVEPRLGRIGGQHAVESPCLRPQFASGRGAAGADAVDPRPRGEQEERRERQAHVVTGKPPPEEAAHRGQDRDHVGGAHPQFLLALDHQAAVERPLLHGLGHIGLGLVQLLAGLDGLLRLELLARPVHLERESRPAADGVEPLPVGLVGQAADSPLLVVDLLSSISLALGQVEQRRGEAVLGDGLGADVLGLHRPEPRRRRVLQREPGRRLDGGAVPEEAAEGERHGERQDPRHPAQRRAEDPVPRVGPRQLVARRGRHVDARPHRDRRAGPQIARPTSVDRVAGDGQVAAGCTDAEADRTLRSGDVARAA